MPKKKDNRCDAIVLNAIAECDRDAHRRCAQRQKGKHPSEMKGSRIKSIITTITASRPGVDKATILNQALEDDKEYFVCSTLARTIKKEEEALEKKKEEEERKRKREEQ